MTTHKEENMAKKMMDVLNELVPNDASSAEIVRAFRKRENLTLEELKDITGISVPNLSAIENGRVEITQYYAEIFAAALNAHPNNILYPNGRFVKSKKLMEIENKAKKMRKHG